METLEKSIIDLSQDHPVIVYDGICFLCHGYIKWLQRRDTKNIIRYIPLQEAPNLYEQTTESLEETILLIDKGVIYTHSDVSILITRHLGKWWSLLMVLRWIPRRIRDGMYKYVASHRYRWFGKAEFCMLPEVNSVSESNLSDQRFDKETTHS